MHDKTLKDQLKTEFQKTNKEDWLKAAESELKSNNPEEALAWGNEYGMSFQPLYDKNDTSNLDYLHGFNFDPKKSPLAPRNWLNLPSVLAIDELKANTMALNHLANGADGILFRIDQQTPDFNKLLNTIDWSFCSLSFALTSIEPIHHLRKYLTAKKYNISDLSGNLFWDEIPADSEKIFALFNDVTKVNCFGLIVESTSPVQEISRALASAVTLIDSLTASGLRAEQIVRNISFSLPTTTNFFIDIAKFKALRLLWFQVAHAFGLTNYRVSDVHIHARSEVWFNENYQPHGNMLKATSSSMAAIMGGCDSLTVYAEEHDHIMMNRIARNVSNILVDESHFNVVADPVAGSYAVENLVDTIAKRAWDDFIRST